MKIAFLGAGSTIFAKNILGDVLSTPALRDGVHLALYDIHVERLEESRRMLETLNKNLHDGKGRITAHLGEDARRDALEGASFVVNAIQVGGYEPATVVDFEIPKKYGLRQTIGDTLGIGGIFRALRTIPVVLDIARDMERVCPDAWFLNYVNPMAMVTGALLRASHVRAVGLCHSVQVCADTLVGMLGLEMAGPLRWHIAGINHQAWLLNIRAGEEDLYPEIRRRAAESLDAVAQRGGGRACAEEARQWAERGVPWKEWPIELRVCGDLVRLAMLRYTGYYVTESSEHSAEYMPYWIKRTHPELIDAYNIPLDEYPRRCREQIEGWKRQAEELVHNPSLAHQRTHEYGSYIMEAVVTGQPARIHGNVLNKDLIGNLPTEACVEVPCLVDGNGITPCHVGRLPEVCAALNRTNVNVQLLTIEAALMQRRDLIYQAAMLDPHAAAELTLDEIRALCDDLIEAHRAYLPTYRNG